jgi:hypothetical protein
VVVGAVRLVLAPGARRVGDGGGEARRVPHQPLPQFMAANVGRTYVNMVKKNNSTILESHVHVIHTHRYHLPIRTARTLSYFLRATISAYAANFTGHTIQFPLSHIRPIIPQLHYHSMPT